MAFGKNGLEDDMKKPLTCLGRSLVVLSIAILVVKLGQNLGDIPGFTWGPWAVISLMTAVVLCALTYVISASIWVIVLRGGEICLKLKAAFIMIGRSNIGKYLPGNLFQFVNRIALARKAGIPVEPIVLSISVNTFLVVVTAATVGIAGLSFSRGSLGWLKEKALENGFFPSLWATVLLLITLSVICPGTRAWIRSRMPYLHPRRVLASVLLACSVFLIYGLSIHLLLRGLWGVSADMPWYAFTSGFALAWALGFIVPGAPAGLGIREAVFATLYGQGLGEGLVISLALMLRVVTSLGDLLIFGTACWLSKQE